MLEIKNVHKSFDAHTEILKGIDLKINKGDVIAILGPSGSGKTTLLRCINYLERADSGTMIFDGEEYDMHAISKSSGLTSGRKMSRSDAKDAAMDALKRVGMADRIDAFPHQLSGGQQQRVAIARGLAANPEIIYFDEPTSALDPELIGEVLNVMRHLAEEGMTMLVVTHEMGFARNVSNYVLFMDDGKVIEQAPSKEFFSNPREERTRSFISSILKKGES